MVSFASGVKCVSGAAWRITIPASAPAKTSANTRELTTKACINLRLSFGLALAEFDGLENSVGMVGGAGFPLRVASSRGNRNAVMGKRATYPVFMISFD
jgi:hypothetical protein